MIMQRPGAGWRDNLYDDLIIDNFAGGGGASTGIEDALGRPPDIAVNHDPIAVAMHQVNHPATTHLCESVWDVDPAEATGGRPVGLAWFSPDCKHFSKAKGGKPVDRRIRGLAWVVIRWAQKVSPRVIILENVEEFTTWGPLGDDGRPCPARKGETFRSWVGKLRALGYEVQWRELRACDYGAPTIRKRLFLIARRDGEPIVWPTPTHNRHGTGGLGKWRTAAECIDFSIPCPSIFLTREEGRAIGVKRPLAEKTMRRIAHGVNRFVIENAEPFIVPIQHYGREGNSQSISDPLRTVTAYPKGGAFAVATPTLIQTGYGERDGQAPRAPGIEKPLGTVVAGGGKHAMVAAFLAKHYGGNETPGAALPDPISTITTQDHHHLVTSHLAKLRGTCRDGQRIDDAAPTVTAGGLHIAEVRAFLMSYYGEGSGRIGRSVDKPAPTVTTKDRLGLVIVRGVEYRIVDIGMRMLTPRELFRAQGFDDSYVIEVPRPDGKGVISKTDQVRLCGNSVCPDVASAMVRANCAWLAAGAEVSS